MSLEERLVDGDVLEADDAGAPFHLEDPVHEEEGIPVRKRAKDLLDVHRAIRYRLTVVG
jgi:hypothetical protein